MKQIIIIGTLHGGWTPNKELMEVLATTNPDKVLVELSPEELLRPRESSIRDEMFAAYDWAIQNSKEVDVFDIENDTLKEGATGKEPEFAELQSKAQELLRQYSWKDLNKQEPWDNSELKMLENALMEKYFNNEKVKERDLTLLENIKSKLIDGVNVVLTGTAHLTSFKQQLPEAKLLFREFN